MQRRQQRQPPFRPSTNTPTRREREVLRLIVEGLSNKQIATTLVIADATVENHLSHIYRKFGVHTRTQAALYALRHSLV